MKRNESFIDRLIGRLDAPEANSIQAYVLRMAKDQGFLNTIFNTIHEGILVIDYRLRMRYANKAAINMLGLPENFSEMRISQFIRDVGWDRILKRDEEEWDRVSRQDIEVFYPVHRYLNFYLVPHESGHGEATVILRDITENHGKTLDRIESEKSHIVSLLAAGVAHEIGNPLNSLYLHLQLLQRQLAAGEHDVDEAVELVQVSKCEVERLDGIISNFLGAVRPSKPDLKLLNVQEIIIDSLNFMKEEIESRDIEIKCFWPELTPNISGDANLLKQAFYNLLKNATQAMPQGGTIEINCVYDDDFLELSVGDTGKGIDQDDMSRIFDPYFTTKKSGSGLGLMIVERIVREHGGELGVTSAPEKGAVFTMRFPRFGKRIRLLPTSETQTDDILNINPIDRGSETNNTEPL